MWHTTGSAVIGQHQTVEVMSQPLQHQHLGYNCTSEFIYPLMQVTVEPGIYFNPVLLKPALANPKQKKFLVKSQIQEYLSFGGETTSLLLIFCRNLQGSSQMLLMALAEPPCRLMKYLMPQVTFVVG